MSDLLIAKISCDLRNKLSQLIEKGIIAADEEGIIIKGASSGNVYGELVAICDNKKVTINFKTGEISIDSTNPNQESRTYIDELIIDPYFRESENMKPNFPPAQVAGSLVHLPDNPILPKLEKEK